MQAATLQTIVCALVDEWDNIRVHPTYFLLIKTFEALSGLESITGLFKRKDTTHAVRYHSSYKANASVKILEFLYFYLIPEPALPKSPSSASSSDSGSSSSSGSDSSSSSYGTARKIVRRTTEEKKGMVGKLLGGEKGVEGLVRDLQEFRPFGDIG